jgi:hypothetical protein
MKTARHDFSTKRFAAIIAVTAFLALTILASIGVQEDKLLLQTSPNPIHVSRDTTPTAQQERVINLWLLVCETRNNSRALSSWKFTANHFQNAATNDTTSSRRIKVEVQNICDGLPWEGFKTKLRSMTNFLDHLLVTSKSNSTKEDEDNNDDDVEATLLAAENPVDIVMLTDSDSFFNPWGVTASQVVDRFHTARKGKPILISAEPNCWNGSFCNQNVMTQVYPNATRSSCPQFVNAGQYMGFAEPLLTMMKSEEMSIWMHKNRVNDQQQLSLWYSKNTEMAQLDVDSLVFRNLMTGYIDSRYDTGSESVRDIFTCGNGDAVRNCSRFVKPYWGAVNASSLAIEMVTVPNCSVSENPFSIHGAGPAKKFVGQLVGQLLSDYEKQQNPLV